MMLSSWQLLIWLCCLLCIAHLSCAAEDRKNYNDDDDDEYDGHVQSSDDVADYDDLHDDDATWLPRRRARRQHRVPTVVEVPGGVDRATLASRRERTHSRRRKKLEDASRRARGGGSRGWRRRSGASMPETSAPVYTTTVVSTTFDRQTSVTSPSTQSVTSHATDHVAHGSEVTAVAELTEDRIQGGDVLTMREDSDDDMMMILMSNNGTTIQLADISHRAVDACRTMQCPRHKVCLLNIQGLPMCRCPSVYHCRGLERRPVCTVDGRTYRNKCFLRVDECAANRRMRVLHRGSCRAGSGTGRRSFDVGPGTPSHRRQRQRQREVEEYVVSADRRSSSDQYQQHRRRRRTRRRRPRHNPITH